LEVSFIPLTSPSSFQFLIFLPLGILKAYILTSTNSDTHIYNPSWPPHARYHNGQTMSLGLFIGLTTYYTLFFLLPRTASASAQQTHLNWILVLQNLVYLSSLSGILYPGAGWTDPEFGEGKPQMFVFPVLVVVT
jgi:hypothetical protein